MQVKYEVKTFEYMISAKQAALVMYATEGCEKSHARYKTQDNQSCPVYLDENGNPFYLYYNSKGYIEYCNLDPSLPD